MRMRYRDARTLGNFIGGSNTAVLYTKVGTRYFFLSPLSLVRYLEIVILLALVRYFQKFVSSLALVHYSATAIFSVVCWQRCY
jgi:hypothetical protein